MSTDMALLVLRVMGVIIDYINNSLSLADEYYEIFGRPLPNGKFICPNPLHKHVNNTPSCKAYGNVFKCFGQCSRVFGVYDLLKWYNPSKINEIKASMVLPKVAEHENHRQSLRVTVDINGKTIAEVLKEITGVDV